MGENRAYPGFDPRVALESNTDFDRVLLANFAAVAASSIGFFVSNLLNSKFGNIAAAYDLGNYKGYLSWSMAVLRRFTGHQHRRLRVLPAQPLRVPQ
jgi:hypothetical protein